MTRTRQTPSARRCWLASKSCHRCAKPSTWLVRILIRKCQDMLRERKRSVPLDEITEMGQDEPGHARVEFLALLDSLDEKYRTVLLLYYGEGFTVKEIAQAMELKEEAVKTRLRRARASLKQIYQAE